MAFLRTDTKSSNKRDHFEKRLEICGLIGNKLPNYTRWELTEFLFIRTFDTVFTIHTNGDHDHYEVIERKYDTVKYECNNETFQLNLLKGI